MKPGTKPYDRNSKQWQKIETTNPCNDFIVEFLVRSKIKIDKQGLNQYYCYNLAIQSVKKYPLPILCLSQLAVIQGFGDFFKTETMKLIKKHYTRGRLPTAEQKKEDEEQQNESLRLNIKKINAKKVQKKNYKNFRKQQNQFEQYSSGQIPQDINQLQSQLQSRQQSSFLKSQKMSKNKSDFSQTSSASQLSRAYKPKPGTQPYQILQIMKSLQAHIKPITRGQINQYLYDRYQQKMKLWHLTRSKLRDHGYIKVDDEDSDFLHLTKKGASYLQLNQNKAKNNKINKQNEEQEQKKGIKVTRKQLLAPPLNPKDIQLLINKKSFNTTQLQQIQKHFEGVKSFRFTFSDYVVGDFLWMIEDQLLDIVMKRINSSQFQENSFLKCCYCLKASQCKEIVMFVQIPAQQEQILVKQKKQLMQDFIIKSKIAKIKIYKSQSLKRILHSLQRYRKILIQNLKNIINGTQIYHQGTLQIFNERNLKKDPNILRNIFISSLRTFPCIHLETIRGIVQRLPCFKEMYDKMSELTNNNQRVQFLNWMLKGYNSKKGINRMIVDFLFLTQYENS